MEQNTQNSLVDEVAKNDQEDSRAIRALPDSWQGSNAHAIITVR